MFKKKALQLFLVGLIVVSVFFTVVKGTANTQTVFNVNIPNGNSLAFQDSSLRYVLITVTNGTLNSSSGRMRLWVNNGYFRFISNNTCTLRLMWTVTNVKVSGDNGNEFRMIGNNTQIICYPTNNVFIQWDVVGADIWLPIDFILGMVGLVSMFGGSLYFVNEIKKGQYEEGFKDSVIIVALGLALVLVWLWP